VYNVNGLKVKDHFIVLLIHLISVNLIRLQKQLSKKLLSRFKGNTRDNYSLLNFQVPQKNLTIFSLGKIGGTLHDGELCKEMQFLNFNLLPWNTIHNHIFLLVKKI
ncbi:hypothetical protein CR513_48043, partial [Mucuna pruriens]